MFARKIVTAFVILVIGILLGSNSQPTITKTEIKEVAQACPVQEDPAKVCEATIKNVENISRGNLVRLRDFDNEAFIMAGQTGTLCSQGMTAIINGDVEAIQSTNVKIDKLSKDLFAKAEARNKLLIELGIPNEQK